MQRWLSRLTTLHWALLVSVLVHAGLLAFRFVDPERFDRVFRDTPLEVILVNARTAEAPTQAMVLGAGVILLGTSLSTGLWQPRWLSRPA